MIVVRTVAGLIEEKRAGANPARASFGGFVGQGCDWRSLHDKIAEFLVSAAAQPQVGNPRETGVGSVDSFADSVGSPAFGGYGQSGWIWDSGQLPGAKRLHVKQRYRAGSKYEFRLAPVCFQNDKESDMSSFLISQILVTIAIVFDFLSFQYKARENTYLCLIISASLICVHYFLLGNGAAGTLVAFTVFRFIVCYYTTDKRFLIVFMTLNVVSIFFVYQSQIDLLIFIGSMIFMIGNFQENNKLMRILMMIGTSLYLYYNIIIVSPMAVVLEGLYLVSNFIGYYRHYIRVRFEKQG